jgi:fluoroquinolone transport system ATP-binding protein
MTAADEICDRVAFIVEGRIALVDRPRDLRLRHGERRVRVEYLGAEGVEWKEFPLAGLPDNAEFLQLLGGREIQTLHTLEATLEEIFIRVTGRGLS